MVDSSNLITTMSPADWFVVAKALALPVGLALGVVIGYMRLRARRLDADRAARDAEKREATVRRHSSGVVFDEGTGIVLREPGDGGEARRAAHEATVAPEDARSMPGQNL